MIIRSLPRKTASFRQLYRYINRDQTIPYSVLWNLNTHNPYNQKKILEQFYDNAQLLSKGKRRNFLYHEIISMNLASGVALDHQMQALRDLALKYVQGRGQNLLAYGRMHLEGKNLHIHLMLSANELENTRRHYLSKSSFESLKKQCEQYLQQRYPELKQPVIFCKEVTEKPNKSRQREYEYTRRTGKKTKKQVVKEILSDLLEQKRNCSLQDLLKDHGFTLYQRGKHFGIIYEGTKYRIATLGLRESFSESVSRPKEPQPTHTHEEQEAETPQESRSSSRDRDNMHRIYEKMKQQEQAMQDIEQRMRDLLDDHFEGEEFSVSSDGRSIYVGVAGKTFEEPFTPNDLENWRTGCSEFLDKKLQPLVQKMDEALWKEKYAQSEQQREVQRSEQQREVQRSKHNYEQPDLEL